MHDARYLFRCHHPRTVRDVYSACNSSTTLWNPGEAGMSNMHDKSLTIIQENSASHQGHHLLHDKSQDPGEKCMAPFSFQEHDGSSLAQPHRVPTLTPAILASEGNNNSKAACRTWLKSKTLSLVESQRGSFLKTLDLILIQLLEIPMFTSSFTTKSVSNAYYTLISDF